MNRVIFVILLLTVTFPAFAQDVRTDLQKHFKDFDLVTDVTQKFCIFGNLI